MAEDFKPIYLANFQENSHESGDKFLTGTICLDDIEGAKEYIHKAKNGKRYLRVIINPFKDGVNEYDNTHSMSVDKYKGKRKNGERYLESKKK
jgi:hypothetical protein